MHTQIFSIIKKSKKETHLLLIEESTKHSRGAFQTFTFQQGKTKFSRSGLVENSNVGNEPRKKPLEVFQSLQGRRHK